MTRRRAGVLAWTLALFCATVPAAAAQAPSEPDRYLVIPFDNPTHEAKLYWLAEASAILIADNLNAMSPRAYTREERLEAFDRLQVPAVASLSRATMIRLGQLVRATHVVTGSLTLTGAEISARAQAIRLDTGRLESEVVETGRLEDLFGVFDRLSRRLASSPPGVASGRTPALGVFENYVKGLLATTASTKVSYLQSALKLDPGFDRARLALWSVHEDNGNLQAALAAAAAVLDTSPAYARARFAAALSLIQLKRLDDAFVTMKTVADRAPSAALLNNMGVVQMRRPVTPQAGKATYYFSQATKLDPDDPDYYFNCGYAYWIERDGQAAVYWLRETVRRSPADGQAHAVLALALQSIGSVAEATRERELASQLSAKPVDVTSRGLERVKNSLDVSPMQRVGNAIAESGQRDQRELAAFHLERGRRLFDQGNDAEAVAEFRRTLYLSPYEADAQLLLGRIYLRTGQTQAAVDAFKIALWSTETADAHLALAHAYEQAKNTTGALAEAQRALALAPDLAGARALVDKLKP